MSDRSVPPTPQDDDAPLDPALERLRRRLMWLLAGSLGVMMLGIIAVFGAILYKTREASAPHTAAMSPAPADMVRDIAIGEGARVLSSSVSDRLLLVDTEQGDKTRMLIVIDVASGRVIGRYRFSP